MLKWCEWFSLEKEELNDTNGTEWIKCALNAFICNTYKFHEKNRSTCIHALLIMCYHAPGKAEIAYDTFCIYMFSLFL
jgi:hypothetical protein